MLKYILLCIVAISGYYAWSIYPVKHGPGEIAPNDPIFEFVSTLKEPIAYKGNRLKPLKQFEGEVRVLAKKQYFFDDRHDLSPIDLLIGWDDMSDERNLNFISFTITDRNVKMKYTRPPIPKSQILEQIELVHLIPSTDQIEHTAKKLRSGHIINLEGVLVEVLSNGASNWTTNALYPSNHEIKKMILWVTKIEVL